MANDFLKIAKGSFPTGTMSVYINLKATTDRDIVGKVIIKANYSTFIKGVWMKLVGTNSVFTERYGVQSHDLLVGEDDYYKDGFHQVLIGFGDGDNCHGTYLELASGRHSWPFSFKVPYHVPATYFDGRNSINYKLVATLESPLIQNTSSRLVLNHEYIVQNYSNYSYVRLKEAQISENRELLRCGAPLAAPKDSTAGNGGTKLFPSLFGLLRSPVKLTIAGHPRPQQDSQTVGGVGASSLHCAMFPFATQRSEYEVLCTLEHHRVKHPLIFKTELYTELCTRASPRLAFSPTYPHLIGAYNSAADDPNSAINAHSIDVRRGRTDCRTTLIWSGTTEVEPAAAEKVVLKVPVDVHTAPRDAAVNSSPLPLPLLQSAHEGKIIHYTTEAPLFRYRVMLKVSVLRTDIANQLLCAPVFGEIFILPPRPATEGAAQSSVSAAAAISAATVTSGPVPVPSAPTGPSGRRPSAGRALVRPTSATTATTTTTAITTVGIAATPPAALGLDAEALAESTASEETMQPSPVPGSGSFVSPRATTEGVAIAAATGAATALAPTRPVSGQSRSNRTARNHGGVASFRAAHMSGAAAPSSSATGADAMSHPAAPTAGGSENAHPNVAPASGARTPHAKPTQCSHVIRVDAEPVSRGPAAVLMDRNERRNEPIRTPQRFAFMYHVGVAQVVDGTPIVSVPTPVPISTVEYRAVRRSYGIHCDTPDQDARLRRPSPFAQQLDGLLGFQFNRPVESGEGTPRPPQQQSVSIDSSFEQSGAYAEDGGLAMAGAVVALPLPGDDADGGGAGDVQGDLLSRMFGAAVGETPRQVRRFGETFNGVDWLATHTQHAGENAHNPTDEQQVLDTARTDVSLDISVPPLVLV